MTVPQIPDDAAKYLEVYGWLEHDPDPEAVESTLVDFQEFMGLDPTGEYDAATAEVMELPRCAVPDAAMSSEQRICQWPRGHVVRYFSDRAPNRDWKIWQDEIIREAFDSWTAVAGIRFVAVRSPQEANIWIQWGPMLPSTLGFAYFPCGAGPNTRLGPGGRSIVMSRGQRWQPRPFALAVFAHEIGHAIGIDHLPRGNLLQSTYTPQITAPRARDIQEAVRRYGGPTPIEPDIPPVGGPAWPDISGTF